MALHLPETLSLDELVDELHAEDIARLEDLLRKHADFQQYLQNRGDT